MNDRKPVIVGYDMMTSYGYGVDACWDGLMSGETSIENCHRFDTSYFVSNKSALVPDIKSNLNESLMMTMLRTLFNNNNQKIPKDVLILIATINGEIDLLERYVLGITPETSSGKISQMIKKIKTLISASREPSLISAACASGTVAVGQAASRIMNGEEDCVLVIACDIVSEFLFSGFSSLMALDTEPARPFDIDRKGLTIGEGAGFILMMSEKRALLEKRNIFSVVKGWGVSCDALHMTGPVKDGSGLVKAIESAIDMAGLSHNDIGNISAHGTGTIYNDNMEIEAFRTVFGSLRIPTYSIKGGIGHTMGAAGVLELIIAVRSLSEGVIPGTINLKNSDTLASDWVNSEKIKFTKNSALSVNSGFGGVNSAVIIQKY